MILCFILPKLERVGQYKVFYLSKKYEKVYFMCATYIVGCAISCIVLEVFLCFCVDMEKITKSKPQHIMTKIMQNNVSVMHVAEDTAKNIVKIMCQLCNFINKS